MFTFGFEHIKIDLTFKIVAPHIVDLDVDLLLPMCRRIEDRLICVRVGLPRAESYTETEPLRRRRRLGCLALGKPSSSLGFCL